MIFLERRKGKAWIFVQIALLAALLYVLFRLLS